MWIKDWDEKWIWKTAFKLHSSSSCTQTDIFPIVIFFLLSCCKIITCSYSEPFLWLKLYKQLIHLPQQQRRKCLSVFRYIWTVAIFQEKKLLWNIWTDIQKWKAGGCYPMVWRDNVSLPFWANIRSPPLYRQSSSARGLGPWSAWSAARNK